MAATSDLYETVTARVLHMMEIHGDRWVNPFGKKTQAHNLVSQKSYKGINQIMLNWSQYESTTWATYKQWSDNGCQVKRGQRATGIVFWQFIEKVDADGKKKTIPMLRHYSVFNAEQVDGYTAPAEPKGTVDTLAIAETVFQSIGATIEHTTKAAAYYVPALDKIHMPVKAAFADTPTSSATECYYSTLAHECVHWTGHKSRLDRDLTGFCDQDYAREELVAELGAAMLCASLRISNEPRPDHAHYLNSWIKRLRDHKREFVVAAGAAAKAVDFIITKANYQI